MEPQTIAWRDSFVEIVAHGLAIVQAAPDEENSIFLVKMPFFSCLFLGEGQSCEGPSVAKTPKNA